MAPVPGPNGGPKAPATRARDALDSFLAKRGESQTVFGARVGASQKAVSKWLLLGGRPQPHTRKLIELATGGAVRAVDWLTPPERAQQRSQEREAAKRATGTTG